MSGKALEWTHPDSNELNVLLSLFDTALLFDQISDENAVPAVIKKDRSLDHLTRIQRSRSDTIARKAAETKASSPRAQSPKADSIEGADSVHPNQESAGCTLDSPLPNCYLKS